MSMNEKGYAETFYTEIVALWAILEPFALQSDNYKGLFDDHILEVFKKRCLEFAKQSAVFNYDMILTFYTLIVHNKKSTWQLHADIIEMLNILYSYCEILDDGEIVDEVKSQTFFNDCNDFSIRHPQYDDLISRLHGLIGFLMIHLNLTDKGANPLSSKYYYQNKEKIKRRSTHDKNTYN